MTPERRRRSPHSSSWGSQGAQWEPEATSFALWAPEGSRVQLCLVDDERKERRLPVAERHGDIWTTVVEGISPGQRYGWRVDGPWEPHLGRRFNAAKLLLDPYAKAVDGELLLSEAIYGHRGPDTVRDDTDNLPFVPLSVVTDPSFDWRDDVAPATSWSDTVIYEAHPKGLTRLHTAVPPQLRGTYAGLAHPAVIEHLVSLGVTAVQLLPVHQAISEPSLIRRGLHNYWGYNSIGFFAPHNAYACSGSRGQQVGEFRSMVLELHRAGLEVILDVVFNHTAEGDERGPTLSFRGLGNDGYYRLRHGHRYTDVTGCGATMDLRHPQTLQLVMDSLRYWVTEMHVDGFRFDLAPALGRTDEHFDVHSAFLMAIHQDPVLRTTKLIAEPWDIGPGGYQLGNFRRPWSEWNDKFRDDIRQFWLGDSRSHTGSGVRSLAYRISGSSDVFGGSRRGPDASVNFVTAHDGFTTRDLVTYDHKHNEGNGEHNRDGSNDNRSWNCGTEGETTNPLIGALRRRQMRNLLSTLLLSTGVPMLAAGDEMGRTQKGNNNAYCQDNETSWVSWELAPWQQDLLTFTRSVIALRRNHPVLRQVSFFAGRRVHEQGVKDIAWFSPWGEEMSDAEWFDPGLRTLTCYLWGGVVDIGPRGDVETRLRDATFAVVLHAGAHPTQVTLPSRPWAGSWREVLDTVDERPAPSTRVIPAGATVSRAAWSLGVYAAAGG